MPCVCMWHSVRVRQLAGEGEVKRVFSLSSPHRPIDFQLDLGLGLSAASSQLLVTIEPKASII